jgi:hypothetical protein
MSTYHPTYTLDALRATAAGSHERFLVLTRDHAREMLASVEAEIAAAYERGKAEAQCTPEDRRLLTAVIAQLALLTDDDLQREMFRALASDPGTLEIVGAEDARRRAVLKGTSV